MKKLLSKKVLGEIAYKISTDKSFKKVYQQLEKTVSDNNFNIVGIHDMRETFEKNNLEIDKDFEYKIVQICNAKKAHKALIMSGDLGIMMPKNILISRENNKTVLRFMQMKPWIVGMMFPDIDIAPMSKNVMATMRKIVNKTVEKA